MNKVFTLVAMQLADKLDFSYLKSFRSALFKILLSLIKFIVVTAVFFLIFMVCSMFGIFKVGASGLIDKTIPDEVLAVIFTVLQLMSILSCTVGLTNSLYKSMDNKVLLALPVGHNQVFFSKIILYYVYELIKNLNLTLPMFIAYGINNGAVWYYYIWLIIGFVVVSALPVIIGAVLSIPWLFISAFIDRYKVFQAMLIITIAMLITYILFGVVSLIPANINIIRQLEIIKQDLILPFLHGFTSALVPYYWITKMIVGGTYAISGNLFAGNTLIYFLGLVAFIVVCFLIAYFLAKPLFFKMASKQFEFEKKDNSAKQNVIHKKFLSPLAQDLKKNFRSSRYVAMIVVQLFLPAILLFLLNKLYGAMNMSNDGTIMTKAFNMLVLFLSVLSFNNEFACVYSVDGNARFLEKTRPINPAVLTFSRLIPRIIISTVSVFIATAFYAATANEGSQNATVAYVSVNLEEFIYVVLSGSFLSVAHLLWCAEMDIMNPQSDQYATVGMTFNNPNVRNATFSSLLLSILFAFCSYFLRPFPFAKLTLLTLAFLVARVYLYFIRVKLYYKEK
ncbi:MAG: hypothetical protein E7348_05090 [Clostridiales bacterium]|nr:hypothetical protein [Clostridiales bacterium]